MPRGRHRFKVAVNAGVVKAEWEWIGFRSGTTFGNLDTTIVHEMIPVIADNTVGIQSFTVHRVVGAITVRHQSGIITNNGLGFQLGVESAGSDQTSDDPLTPITTDIDAFAHKGVMWWWTGQPQWTVPIAETDIGGYQIPIDIKVKRIVNKRQRLVLVATAATTGRMTVLVNLRALIRESAGS